MARVAGQCRGTNDREEEYDEKLREVDEVCDPVIKHVYKKSLGRPPPRTRMMSTSYSVFD